MSVSVEDMDERTAYFVAACSHVNESAEIDACAEARLRYLEELCGKGLRVLVAVSSGRPVGMACVVPASLSPWGPFGENLTVMPCLFVVRDAAGAGAGRS
ncbi:MAG: hypothetical protein NUV93_03745, partial [Firmicutes bacterium]|nr:hypothetical protein [Bacillota bacterium]